MRGVIPLIAVVGLSLINGGCVSALLSRKVVQAPNQQTLPKALANADISKLLTKEDPELWRKVLDNPPISQGWRVATGAPAAEIAVVAIEPAEHEVKVTTTISRGRAVKINTDIKFVMSDKVRPAKGTIVLLHGICMTKESMLAWALYLSSAGYRTVLVDLRGHGASTGDYITYGYRERDDLVAVLDSLEKRGLSVGKVGVLGISYGAVMGMQWAARDPRVEAVVALAPFSEARRAVASFVRDVVGGPLSLLSPARLNAAIDQAAGQAGFAWKDVDVWDAVEKITHPVLFYHGAYDSLLPVWHSANLRSLARPGSRLVITPDDDHMTLAMRLEPMSAETLAWFDTHLAPTEIPANR